MAKTVESDSSFPSRGSPDTDASVKLIPSSRNWKASSKLCSVLLNKCQSLEIAKWHFVGYPSCKIITTLSINSRILSQYPHLMSHTAGLLRQDWSLLYLSQASEAQEDKQSRQYKCESLPNWGRECRCPGSHTSASIKSKTFTGERGEILTCKCTGYCIENKSILSSTYSHFSTIFPMRLKNLLPESICFFKTHFRCNFF